VTTPALTRGVPVPARRPPLVTRPLLVWFLSIIGFEVSFYLPLSVVPLYVKSSGSAAGAGAATGALLAATVAAEMATPRLVARAGYRLSLAAGLFLLGAPALVLLMPASLAVVIAVNIARGVGFAVTTVAGGTLTASLIPAQRRGEGLGLVGIVANVPALACLPGGVWMAPSLGIPAGVRPDRGGGAAGPGIGARPAPRAGSRIAQRWRASSSSVVTCVM
jgi:hypothetical protein